MSGHRKKTKQSIELYMERQLVRAIDLQVAREKTDRTKWLTALAEDKLRALGKLP